MPPTKYWKQQNVNLVCIVQQGQLEASHIRKVEVLTESVHFMDAQTKGVVSNMSLFTTVSAYMGLHMK